MSTSDINPGERVKYVHGTDDILRVDLVDGRTIEVPLAWYPKLVHATPEQRGELLVAVLGFIGRTLMKI